MCARVFYVKLKGDFDICVFSSTARISLINLATGKIGGSGKDTAACVVVKYCVLSIFETGV